MNGMRSRLPHALTLLVAALVGLLGLGRADPAAAQAAAQAASTQVVFSATSEPGSFCRASCKGPAEYGFWIWCEADGGNPYADTNGSCNGSMYFYNIEPFAEAVTGTVSLSATTATMTVGSATTAPMFIACQLTNSTDLSGPKNTISVECNNPSASPGPTGSFTTLPNAIVKIVALQH